MFQRLVRSALGTTVVFGLIIAAPVVHAAVPDDTPVPDPAETSEISDPVGGRSGADFGIDEVGRLAGSTPTPAGRVGNQMRVTDPPPLPPLPLHIMPPHDESGRRVVYSKTNQWVWTVEEDGFISMAQPVSGRRTWNQPLAGTYRVLSRSAHTCNITNRHICMRWMVRFTVGPDGDNIGFHEIPRNTQTGNFVQTEAQLGQARSAGCIRMSTAGSEFIWNWAPIGTKVVVLP
jgi:hypothetical protein